MTEKALCTLCGEPMPAGEEMFKFHGYSGPCPKPPTPKPAMSAVEIAAIDAAWAEISPVVGALAPDASPELMKVYSALVDAHKAAHPEAQ